MTDIRSDQPRDESLAATKTRADTVLKDITLCLWDSQGQKEENQVYLRAMQQFLRDKYLPGNSR